ncbi:MAG: FAD-binding oxidoreductase [Fibrobacteres bacterium]|nr:FAD-binding oxidoreductase [Fibrobacterota bacterium]
MRELSGWGGRPRFSVEEMEPDGRAGLSDLIGSPYLPRGRGRSYGDAGLPASGHRAVNSRRFQRILSFDAAAGVVDAEAGVTFKTLLALVLPRGFFLPVTPGTMDVTLGGALASNVHGKNHHRAGSIERFVIEAEVATPIGTFTCSPSERPDLFRATVGGYGLTGFIVRAKLRLVRVATAQVEALRLRAPDLAAMFALFARHDHAYEYSVAWLDTLARGRSLGRGVLMLGNHAAPSGRQPGPDLALRPRRALAVPFALPGFAFNRPALTAFNGLFYRFSRAGRSREPLEAFFYPLDRIRDWNRLYGRRGFFQYQCAIPDPNGEAGMAEVLDLLARERLGAFLSVLKRCGDDEALLPFCKRGYTLALDVPYRGPATLAALDRLDELVIRHGGRVYLTKDARLSPAAFRAMYPEAPAFMATVRHYNPEAGGGRRCDSRLAQRLGLWQV